MLQKLTVTPRNVKTENLLGKDMCWMTPISNPFYGRVQKPENYMFENPLPAGLQIRSWRDQGGKEGDANILQLKLQPGGWALVNDTCLWLDSSNALLRTTHGVYRG